MSSDNEVEIFDEASEERDSQVEEGEPDVAEDEVDLAGTEAADAFLLGDDTNSDSDSTFIPDQSPASSQEEALMPENSEDDMQEVLEVLGQDGVDALLESESEDEDECSQCEGECECEESD